MARHIAPARTAALQFPKCSCTWRIAMDSPTADATRLTEPLRTSASSGTVWVPAAPRGGPARFWSDCGVLAGQDDHRGVVGLYSEPPEQPFRVLVAFGVNPTVRWTISRCKVSKLHGNWVEARADDSKSVPS